MDDARGMRFFQRARHLDRNVQGLGQIHRHAAQTLSQRDAVNKLGGNEVASTFIPHFINRKNVGMV